MKRLWWMCALMACGDGAAGDAGDGPPRGTDASLIDAAEDLGPPPDDAALDAIVDPDARPLSPSDPPPPEWRSAERAFAAVDPFVGSGGVAYGYAGLTPAAMTPNGLVKLGPDTTRDGVHARVHHFSGYHFDDPQVRGFSHVRLIGTGVPDLGNLRVLPVRDLPADPGRAWEVMDKASERAAPGRYAVTLPDAQVEVALTASTWAGLHRYTATAAGRLWLLVDAAASVEDEGMLAARVAVDGAALRGEITFRGSMSGRTRPSTLFFAGAARPAPVAVESWTAPGVDAGPGATGVALGYDVAAGDVVELDFGVSYLDAIQAARNLETASPGFDAVAQASAAAWAAKLARMQIPADTDEATARMLYTALFQTYRMPTRYDEPGGRYRGLDGEVHATAAPYYTDLSLWDTFRTLHPWLELVDPDVERDVLRSLLAMADDGGTVPRWPAGSSEAGSMIGSSADMLFAGGHAKGLEGVDYQRAFDALMRTAMGPPPPGSIAGGRGSITEYLALGYVPSDTGSGSVSETLEYAYSDWALAGLARALGRPEADALADRGGWYANLYDPDQRLFAPRAQDGTFAAVNPTINYMAGGPYVEGTAWHWRFSAFHDPDGLAALYDGDFLSVLDEFFERSKLALGGRPNPIAPDPYYWHGNEPALHAVWLYAHFEQWAALGRWVRAIQREIYHPAPDGYPGNDDGGTLSAWYLFSAIGLFPIPGSDRYYLGPPLLPDLALDVGGHALRITAPGAPTRATIRRVWADDTLLEGPTIDHATLRAATRLHFELE